MNIELEQVKRNNPKAREYITNHYTQPRGFIGRNTTHLIKVDGNYCGVVVGGSTSLYLPYRKEFFGDDIDIQKIINNRLFRLELNIPNLGTQILKLWRKQVVLDWNIKYNCIPIGFETLVKPPRNGAVYRADNWVYGGMTKGWTTIYKHKDNRSNINRMRRHRLWIKTEPRLIFFKMI